MKNAYGHNRDPKDFAHVDYDADRLFIDHGENREKLDALINGQGLQGGDTLSVLTKGDLGKGMAANKTAQLIELMGVDVVICEPPGTPSLPRGRPGFSPPAELDETLRTMWKNPIGVTTQAVIDRASKDMGETITRNQLNHRYGNRYKTEASE